MGAILINVTGSTMLQGKHYKLGDDTVQFVSIHRVSGKHSFNAEASQFVENGKITDGEEEWTYDVASLELLHDNMEKEKEKLKPAADEKE